MKRMIMTVINGAVYKVAPRTVEEVIDKHPGVLESCVVRYKKGGNYLLKAYVVCQEGQNVSEKELIEHCAKRLSNIKMEVSQRYFRIVLKRLYMRRNPSNYVVQLGYLMRQESTIQKQS